MKISDADIQRIDDGLFLKVIAYSPTLGWKNVGLNIPANFRPPADGIINVILMGTPPATIPQLDAIQTYILSEYLPDEEWFRGVRIFDSSENIILTLYAAVKETNPVGKDEVEIEAAALKKDKLLVNVSYSGGCKKHELQLNWDGLFLKSDPPQVILGLSHNANGEFCRMLKSEQLQFDLSPIIPEPHKYVINLFHDDDREQDFYTAYIPEENP